MEDEDLEFMGPAVSRLEKPLSFSDIMTKCPEFSISSVDEIENEEEISISSAYTYDQLQPYALYEALEPDDEAEDDNPANAFPIFRKQMHCVGDDDKIMKKIERCGLGEEVGNAEKVVTYIHYAAYSEMEEYPFDVSRLRHKKPVVLRLGIDSVVLGMEIAIRTMKKGEKSKFLIHPDLAFGDKGVQPRIPPAATILYDIELIDFSVNEALNLRFQDDEESLPKTFEETLKIAKQLHQHANKLKKLEKNVNAAIAAYRKALFLLIQCHYQNDADEKTGREEMLKLYTNLAVCLIGKKAYKRVCIEYNRAIHDCPGIAQKSAKLLYNSAKALRFLGDYNEAAKRMKQALRLKPDDESILTEIQILNELKVEHDAEERNRCRMMFGFYNKNDQNPKDEKYKEDFIDQVNEEFRHIFMEQINEFMESDLDSNKFSFGATAAEKEFCRSVCKKKNLSFRETKMDGNTCFIITKKT